MPRQRSLRGAERLALTAAILSLFAACSTHSAGPYHARDLQAEQLDATPAAHVEELLDARFAGVRVLRLGGGRFSVQVRGLSTVHGHSQPLYVVDGIPLPEVDEFGPLGINPNDILRIEVLKDIGSMSLYGVRGANGVILITTRGAALD